LAALIPPSGRPRPERREVPEAGINLQVTGPGAPGPE